MSAAMTESMAAVLRMQLALLGAVLGGACQREAIAQPVDDPLAPIGCFEIVDARNIASDSVIDLCTAATSLAPAQCFVNALDRHHELSTSQIIQLCRRATTLEPLGCYERLDREGKLTEDQLIGYCAMYCPVGPPAAQSASPACFAAALARTSLAEQTIGQLCFNSRSAGPVDCYLRGLDSNLSDTKLVQLCAQTASCQYVTAVPVPAY